MMRLRLLDLLLCGFLAVLSGHYFEVPQAHFFSGIKAQYSYGIGAKYHKPDESGILRSRLIDGSSESSYINPVTNAQVALWQAEAYLFNKYFPEYLEYLYYGPDYDEAQIVSVADMFLTRYKPEIINGHEIVRFPYDVDINVYGGLTSPWYSAMASAHVLVVVLAAGDITGDEKYKAFAKNTIDWFNVPVRDGGCIYKTKIGILFEEYCSPTSSYYSASKVLNGHYFAFDGIFWFLFFNPTDSYSQYLTDEWFKWSEDNTLNYSGRFWSYYDYYRGVGNYADGYYHRTHVVQLDRIVDFYAKILDKKAENLAVMRDQFKYQAYSPLGFIERMLIQRNRMVFVIFLSNMTFFLIIVLSLRRVIRSP